MNFEARIWARLDSLAKPRRSLGKLEDLAARIATIQCSLTPLVRPRRLVLFAADHGVVASGVSAWPSTVTGLMVRTIVANRAASTALAAAHGCDLRVIDVGVAASLKDLVAPNFFRARVAAGTQDLSQVPAMTTDEFDTAWQIGVFEARQAVEEGHKVLLAGEMGIGNTTPAACLTSLLAEVPASQATGRGAGADEATLEIKRAVVTSAATKARVLLEKDVRAAIASVAGFEIVAMAGFFAEGAKHHVVLLLDGYVATAAALIAERLQPGTSSCMIAAHLSAEPGHGGALAALGLCPLIEWNMRLGEGTGALVALPMLDSAVALIRDVASLEELGVGRED
jgi:nicotinate-nucleotide--dimethylbenzimidazole phosphoribosyltransferase